VRTKIQIVTSNAMSTRKVAAYVLKMPKTLYRVQMANLFTAWRANTSTARLASLVVMQMVHVALNVKKALFSAKAVIKYRFATKARGRMILSVSKR